jgi:hypothetical protein
MDRSQLTHFLVCILAAFSLARHGHADQASAPEYTVKAAFLYNFTKFVEWPAEELQEDEIFLCILGADPFGQILNSTVGGKIVRGKSLTVKRYERLEEVARCHLLFLGYGERRNLPRATQTLRASKVLIVSEAENFGEPDGMIKLVIHDKKVRIEINVAATRAAGLEVSSRLLDLAVLVGEATAGTVSP